MPSWAIWKPRPVFVTSTFTDMQAERDYLRDHVFPELEQRLKERFCHLEPIDLRWGVETVSVDEAQSKELLVLKVCLAEIERSRPFLIALIGDRYGWIPPEDRMSAAAQEAGFQGDISGKSVTALEIEFGVIESTDQRRRSRFYFRDTLPYDRMDPQTAAAYSDKHSNDPDAQDRHDRLQKLKTRIKDKMREWGMPDRVRTYHAAWDDENKEVIGLEEWGRQVLEDLWQDLEEETRDYARLAPDTWQRQESLVLEQFVETQCRDFVGREELIGQLLGFATSPTSENAKQGICLVGRSGSGKSATFAKLVRELEDKELFLLSHAAGVSGLSVQVDAILRRWIFELAEHLRIPDPTNESTPREELEQVLSRLLSQAAADSRVVCLIDALNQFERTPSGRYVTWFPRILHPNVRLIATAIPGRESEALAERPWVDVKDLPLLTELEARDIVRSVCRRYHKTPNPEVLNVLVSKKLPDGTLTAGIPLWLELAVEELLLLDADDFARADREFTGTPEQRLHALLLDTAEKLPPDVETLYDNMLERTEQLYGQKWARGFANLIAVSRSGWRESDMEALLTRLTDETWDPLRFGALRRSFRAHLVQRGAQGQWDFFHAQTRAAVLRRNLADAETAKRLHSASADHLESLGSDDPVRETELMYHLIGADDRPRAARYYSGDLITQGELAGASRCVAEHIAASGDAQPNPGLGWVASLLDLSEIEPMQVGMLCMRYIFDLSGALASEVRLSTRFSLLESASSALGRLAASDLGNIPLWQRGLSISYGKVGDVLVAQGDLGAALESYRASLAIRERLAASDPGNASLQRDLSISQEKIGDVLRAQGDLGAALESYRVSLAISERLAASDPGNAAWQRDLSVSQGKVGDVLRAQGNLGVALESYRASLAIAERLAASDPGNAEWQDDLSISQGKVGDVFCAQGDLGSALESYRASLAVAERLAASDPGNAAWQRNLSISHGKVGDAQGDLGSALESCRASLAIAERLAASDPGNAAWQHDLSNSQDRVGNVLRAQGDLGSALESYRASLAISERLVASDPGNAAWQRDLSVSHNKIGDVRTAQGDLTGALESYRASLAIRERLAASDPGNAAWQRDLCVSCWKMAMVSEQAGKDDAMSWWRKAYETLAGMKRRGLFISPQDEQYLEQLRLKVAGEV
ncbi:MAG TPA: tetratricopeptide repeat protein [Armatimonadota bacterium]|nr:tetratricopeptide repeat protein [Armatimonadota bacterium]